MANMGKAWESQLEAYHHQYAKAGHACIFRTPPPTKVISMGRGGRFTGCYAASGPPDYTGTVQGHGVTFDAKSTKADRWALKAVTPGQAKQMTAFERCDGFAFIALKHPSGLWMLPWASLGIRWCAWASGEGRAVRGSASLSVDDLGAVGVRFSGSLGWLSAVLEEL